MELPFPNNYNDKLSYIAQYVDDEEKAYVKNFVLNFYPVDKTLSLFDIDLSRSFLKRSICPGVHEKDIFVGNTINVYGRKVVIHEYADGKTRKFIGTTKDHTVTLIKPGALKVLGKILTDIESRKLQIVKLKMFKFTRKEALDFYSEQKDNSFLPFIIEHVVSGPLVAAELVGDNAVEKWQKELGHFDPIEARKGNPNSLRAIYGQDRAANAFHAPKSHEQAVRETFSLFSDGNIARPTPTYQNSTCCIIKPHAIIEGKLGYIIKEINESEFYISAMQMFYLNKVNTEELFEVYKGVISDFNAFISSFLFGPCVAMEISSRNSDMNVHTEFRKFTGPLDSDIARQIRPHTLRAKFGVEKYQNAVHCTDLPEDTVLELEYFFEILN